jgi:transaldolase/glucose-6-phosphate isomerase
LLTSFLLSFSYLQLKFAKNSLHYSHDFEFAFGAELCYLYKERKRRWGMKKLVLILGFLFFVNCVILFNIENDLAFRRVWELNLFKSEVINFEMSKENLIEDQKRFPVDPNKEVWLTLPTQDTHWLTLPQNCQGMLDKIKTFAQAHQGEYEHIVVIGMGGSSRPADVIKRVLGTKAGGAQIHVMENLDDADIQEIRESIDPAKTLFISISKSGGTAETMALTRIAYDWITSEGLDPSKHFIAITTTSKDSPLMRFLKENNVPEENIFEHPDKVGGRYTIFSVIGMLPAALAGHDIDGILSYARAAMRSAIKYQLGRFLADMESQGRIYMRVILPKELEGLGSWIEQLLAESLGKVDKNGRNRGIVPVLERDYDASTIPGVYNENAFVFRIKLGESDERDGFMGQVKATGIPVWEMQVNNPEEAVGSLYLLEFATGMAGVLMGIDPFDQPGVEAGKQATREMKARIAEMVDGGISLEEAYRQVVDSYKTSHRIEIAEGIYLDYGDFMNVAGDDFRRFVEEKGKNFDGISAPELYTITLEFAKSKGKTYGAILPYAKETPERAEVWSIARGVLRRLGLQDVFGIGPVYEHSLRQYLQQGPDKGIPTFIVVNDPGHQIIPGDKIEGFTCGMQNALQALGTQQALARAGRYTLRIEVEGPLTSEKLEALRKFFEGIRR